MTEENQNTNQTNPTDTSPLRNIPNDFFKKQPDSLDHLDDPAVKPIKTFELDAAQFLKDKNTTVSDIALAEHKRRLREVKKPATQPVEQRKSKMVLVLSLFSLFFVIASIAIIYFVISIQKDRPVLVNTESVLSLIPIEAEKEIDFSIIDRDKIKNILASERENASLTLGKILGFYFTEPTPKGKSLIKTTRFFEIAKFNPPAGLIRSFSKEFLLGIHSFNGNQPFLILKTNSFQQAYTGMLGWENNLIDDLSPLFYSPEKNPEAELDSTEKILNQKGFVDSVLKNKDVRILRNDSGKIILIYSIIDKDTIVITTNEYSFTEVITRLTTKKLVR